jgi:hypothetical protein
MVARWSASPSQVFLLSKEVGDSGDAVNQKQRIAIFETRAPVYATHLSRQNLELHPHSNQRFLEGHRRGVRRLSHDLSYLTGQQLLQGATHKTYVDVTCIKFPWSSDGHDLFPLASLQNGNLSESMTQIDKEIMAGRWRGMLGRLDDRYHLE